MNKMQYIMIIKVTATLLSELHYKGIMLTHGSNEPIKVNEWHDALLRYSYITRSISTNNWIFNDSYASTSGDKAKFIL